MIQYEFMPPKGPVDAVFIPRRLLKCFDLKTSYFLCLLSCKCFRSGTKRSYPFCFKAKGCFRILGKWGYVTASGL